MTAIGEVSRKDLANLGSQPRGVGETSPDVAVTANGLSPFLSWCTAIREALKRFKSSETVLGDKSLLNSACALRKRLRKGMRAAEEAKRHGSRVSSKLTKVIGLLCNILHEAP